LIILAVVDKRGIYREENEEREMKKGRREVSVYIAPLNRTKHSQHTSQADCVGENGQNKAYKSQNYVS